jgi:predicted regulator of Ras-like GTPase activity (Roadblock/LC7/MglB family)
VKAAVVVARDGFVIEGVTSTGALDADTLGAAVSTELGSAEIVGREMLVGKMTQAMTEYEDGVIFVSLLGADAVLAVVANHGANLGNVRYQVRKRTPQIELVL